MTDMEKKVIELLQQDINWIKEERESETRAFLIEANAKFTADVSFAERLTGKKVVVISWIVELA